MEVVLTTGAIRRGKLQANRHHQRTNTQFYRPEALPVTQPTVSEHWRESVSEVTTVWRYRNSIIIIIIQNEYD